jgi:hypothetical protein
MIVPKLNLPLLAEDGKAARRARLIAYAREINRYCNLQTQQQKLAA